MNVYLELYKIDSELVQKMRYFFSSRCKCLYHVENGELGLYNNFVHVCNDLCMLVNKIHNLGFELNVNFSEKFITFVLCSNCLMSKTEFIIGIVLKVVRHYLQTKKKLRHNIDPRIVNLIITITNKFMKCERNEKFNKDLRTTVDVIFDCLVITSTVISQLCCCRNRYLLDKIETFIIKSNDDFEMQLLYKACNFYPESNNVLFALMNKGMRLDDHCLELIYKNCPIEVLFEVFSSYDIFISSFDIIDKNKYVELCFNVLLEVQYKHKLKFN